MTYDDDMLLHYGRKGQKWGDHIFGRSRDSAFSSRRRRRREGGLDERAREIALLNLYRNRDRVSTRVLKEKISRIETEQKLKKLVEAPTIARVEAKRKRLQGRLQFAAKIASAGLDIYSKWPDNGVTKKFNPKTQKKELEKALDEFQYRKGIAKAIKDAPLTLTKFDDKGNINTSKLFQSVNVAGVDVYIPETIQNRFMIHHSGRKGMELGLNIFGRRSPKGVVHGKNGIKSEQQKVKMPKKLRRSVDEKLREAQFRDMYRTRDSMSTKVLKSKIARLEAEQRFKQLVEAPEKARLEAIKKKKQARLAFVGKVGSAALDVYSKAPSSIAGRNLSGQAAKNAIEAFKKKQEWAKAFKDVPTTMTKFTQSISVGGVDVYIPETVCKKYKRSIKKISNKYSETNINLKDSLIQSGVNMGENINGIYIPSNDDILQQYGVKGMKRKKESDALETMPPDESDVNEPSIKKEEDSYNYNLKMRDAVIKNTLKRIRDMREKNSSKVDTNNHNKKTPKK